METFAMFFFTRFFVPETGGILSLCETSEWLHRFENFTTASINIVVSMWIGEIVAELSCSDQILQLKTFQNFSRNNGAKHTTSDGKPQCFVLRNERCRITTSLGCTLHIAISVLAWPTAIQSAYSKAWKRTPPRILPFVRTVRKH